MKKILTQLVLMSIFVMSATLIAESQTLAFVWDKSELTAGWDDAGPATVIKSANGITFEQIGTVGVANTYIRVNHSNNTNNVISLNTTSDALTITSATETISHIKITYSSNGSSSFSNPYVGFHSTASPMGSAVVVTSSCTIGDGVTGTAGVEQTYNAPSGTKFAVIVRGFSCGDNTSPAREIRVYKVEVYTQPNTPVITTFTVAGQEAVVDQQNKTITAELPYGTNLTALTPIVSLGGTATSYTPTGAVNFSSGPVTFTATGGASSTNYTATITASTVASTDATLSDLAVDGVTVTGFNPEVLNYEIAYPNSYSEIPVVTATKNDSKASMNIVQATVVPGTATVTVTAESSAQKVYTVNFTRDPISSACDITSFMINGKKGVINAESNTILVRLPLNTDVTSLTPVVEVSPFATYTPEGTQNFTSPVNYVVRAEDGTQKTYAVSVQLLNMVFNGPYPYETNFPAGYELPDWMGSPTGSVSFVDPYGTPTTGSDKVLWFDNATEESAGTASVLRLSGGNPMEMYLSNCTNITVGLSATGTRTYQLYVDDVLKASSPSTVRDTKVTLSYAVNSSSPVKIMVKSVETASAITIGYLKIDGVGTSVSELYLERVWFDGQTVHNPEHINLELVDIAGRVIKVSNENIDMSKYLDGIYFVRNNTDSMKILHMKRL